MIPDLQFTVLHLGQLHAYEQLLVYLLAFGPFLLIALTIWISRRRNQEKPDDRAEHPAAGDSPPGR